MNSSQKMEKGKEFKNEGNAFFVKGEFQKGKLLPFRSFGFAMNGAQLSAFP
jgi:hypothetical protein